MSDKILGFKELLEAVGKTPIKDETTYSKEMTKSFIDKLFFIDQVDTDVIVDFGCADAFILSKIRMLKPDLFLIGYDLDKSMLSSAKDNLDDENSFLTDNWYEVLEKISTFQKPMLLLSSVIHEVYSYSTTKEVNNFWKNKVFSGKFKYVCIRDMIPTNQISRVTDFQQDVEIVRELSDKYYLESFEREWGDISKDYRTFIHYLLKYRYKDNWDRELLENYVPISLQTLMSKIPPSYKVEFQQSYLYSFFAKVVKEDFGIDIKGQTHLKMILEKK